MDTGIIGESLGGGGYCPSTEELFFFFSAKGQYAVPVTNKLGKDKRPCQIPETPHHTGTKAILSFEPLKLFTWFLSDELSEMHIWLLF